MTPVFADRYYWLALINSRDSAHHEAVALAQFMAQRLVTTTWVLTEVGDAMRMPANRTTFVQFLQDIAADSETIVVPAEQKWFDRGVALYAARLDKKWSLTDCISIIVMQDMGLTEILTADGDFAQAVFEP